MTEKKPNVIVMYAGFEYPGKKLVQVGTRATVELYLPGDNTMKVVVSTADVKPALSTIQKEQQSQEFLYPLQSKVKYSQDGKDFTATVLEYHPKTQEYLIDVHLDFGMRYTIAVKENQISRLEKVEESAIEIQDKERKGKTFFPKFKVQDTVKVTDEKSKFFEKEGVVAGRTFEAKDEKYAYTVRFKTDNTKKPIKVKRFWEFDLEKVEVSLKREISNWTKATNKRKFDLHDKVIWKRNASFNDSEGQPIIRKTPAKITGWRYDSKLDEVLYQIEIDTPKNPGDKGMGISGFGGIKESNLEPILSDIIESKFSVGQNVLYMTPMGAKKKATVVAKTFTGKMLKYDISVQNPDGDYFVRNITEGYLEPISEEKPAEDKYKPGDRIIFLPKSTNSRRTGTIVGKDLKLSYGNKTFWLIQHDNASSKLIGADEPMSHEESYFERLGTVSKFALGDKVEVYAIEDHTKLVRTGQIVGGFGPEWLVRSDGSGLTDRVHEDRLKINQNIEPKFNVGDRVLVSGMYKGTVLKIAGSAYGLGTINYLIKWDEPIRHESLAAEYKMKLLDETKEAPKVEPEAPKEPKFKTGDLVTVKVGFHPEREVAGTIVRKAREYSGENRWLVKYDVSGGVWSVAEKNIKLRIDAPKVETKSVPNDIIDEVINETKAMFNDAFKTTKLDQQPDFKEFINRIGEVVEIGKRFGAIIPKDKDDKK